MDSRRHCGSPNCAGCYEVEPGVWIHPPMIGKAFRDWHERWDEIARELADDSERLKELRPEMTPAEVHEKAKVDFWKRRKKRASIK